MANDNDNTKLITNLALLAGGYFLVAKPILEKLGIQKTEEEKVKSEAFVKANNLSAWSPTFWRETLAKIPKGLVVKYFDTATSQKLAKQINDAWGFFNDDEPAIGVVFSLLKSQMDLSRVAEAYAAAYKKDLRTDLMRREWYGLNEDQFQKYVAYHVNKLPVYRTS